MPRKKSILKVGGGRGGDNTSNRRNSFVGPKSRYLEMNVVMPLT